MEQQVDFLTVLFKNISKKIGKSFQDLLPFVKILRDNWYDTQDSIRQITDDQYLALNFPVRLVNCIKQELSIANNNTKKTQIVDKEQNNKGDKKVQTQKVQTQKLQTQKVNEQNSTARQKLIVDIIKKSKQQQSKIQMNQMSMTALINRLAIFLEDIYLYNNKLISETFQTLYKIFHNIILDPYSLKYRTLKKSNNLINRIIVQQQVCRKFIGFFGFSQGQQTFYMHQFKAHELIFAQQILLNKSQLYKQKDRKNLQPFVNLKKSPQNSKNYQKQKYKQKNLQSLNDQFSTEKLADIKYVDALDKLVQFRQKLMSQIPKDRKIKIYHKNLEKRDIRREQIIIGDELQKSQDKIIQSYWKNILEQNKKGTSFQSKRKMEFQFLIKQSIDKQTIIKLKLPNEFIIQASFAPLQKLSSVFSLLNQIIIGQIYMYQAPPVKRLDKCMEKTLSELQSVPSGSFYVGLNGQWYIKNNYASLIKK